jgi:hypothetical protein
VKESLAVEKSVKAWETSVLAEAVRSKQGKHEVTDHNLDYSQCATQQPCINVIGEAGGSTQ